MMGFRLASHTRLQKLGLLLLVALASGFQIVSAKEVPEFLKNYPPASYHEFLSGRDVIGRTQSSWKVDGNRILFEEEAEMKLTLFKKTENILTKAKTWTTPRLEIDAVEFEMRTSQASIRVVGSRSQKTLRLKIFQGPAFQTKDMVIQEPLLVSATIRPYLLMKGLPKKTSNYKAWMFDPSALVQVPMNLSISSEVKDRWRVVVDYLQHAMKSEIDSTGALLREESDLAGLPIEARPVSARGYKASELVGTSKDLVEVARVAIDPIENARLLGNLRLRISGVDLSGFQLTRHRQKLNGQVLEILRETMPSQTLSVDEVKGMKSYLDGDAMTQVHDPLIQKTAKEIVGNEKDLWKRAQLIRDFVFSKLEKTPTISIPNALEVLQSKKGDCNEHAVLFTALARAAGIPTRTVVGLVYNDRGTEGHGFYYHAWVEVFAGKEWVSMDPTWNQTPVDVTHIAFVEGGLDKQVQVTSLMGKIKLVRESAK